MAVAALKREPRRKMFYATMHVTRVEEWCIEAETEEEARELLNNGPTRTYRRVRPLGRRRHRRVVGTNLYLRT